MESGKLKNFFCLCVLFIFLLMSSLSGFTMQEDTVMIEETDASGNVIGQPIIEKVETTESVTERENRAIQLIVETGLKAKFAILKCGLNLESRSPAYRRIARTAGRSGDLFIYNS